MSLRTRRCSCCALPEDTTTTTTAAHFPLACWHRGHSQCQPSRRWAGQQCFFTPPSPSLFCCSPRTNGPISSTCKAEECDATRHNSTCAWRTGCACSQACMRVCEPATQLPHLHLDSSCHNSSRDQQTSLLSGRRHTLNAAPLPLVCGGDPMAHWHASQAPSNETLDPHTLPRTHAFFHEVLVAHWLHGPTSHCFVQCPSECSTAQLPWSLCHHHHHHHQHQQQMRLSPLLARMAAASAADACARQQVDRLHCH